MSEINLSDAISFDDEFEIHAPTPPSTEDPDEDLNEESDEIEESEESETEENNEGSEDSLAKTHYELLISQGLLEEDEEFDGSVDSLKKAFEKTKEKRENEAITTIWESLPDDFKPLLEYGLKGGTSLDAYLKAYAPLELSSELLKTEEGQRRVIKEYYKRTTDFNDARIDKMVSKLESLGELDVEATDAYEQLNEILEEQKEALLKQAEQEKAKEAARRQEFTAKIAKEIDTYEVENTRKDRLKALVFNPIKTEKGTNTNSVDRILNQIYSNPKHFVQLVDLLADYKVDQGFDFNRFTAKSKTKTVKTFENLLETADKEVRRKNNGTPSKGTKTIDWSKFM